MAIISPVLGFVIQYPPLETFRFFIFSVLPFKIFSASSWTSKSRLVTTLGPPFFDCPFSEHLLKARLGVKKYEMRCFDGCG